MNFKKIITLMVCSSFLFSSVSMAGEINWFSRTKKISYGLMALGAVGAAVAVVTANKASHAAGADSAVEATFGIASDTSDDLPQVVTFLGGLGVSGVGLGIGVTDMTAELSSDQEVAKLRTAEHRSLVRYANTDYNVVDESLSQVVASFQCGANCDSSEQREALVKEAVLNIEQIAKSQNRAFRAGDLAEKQLSSYVIEALPSELRNLQSVAVAKIILAVALVNQEMI